MFAYLGTRYIREVEDRIHSGDKEAALSADGNYMDWPVTAASAASKAIKFHGRAKSGGLLLGASVPVTFNSRSDHAERRINSLLLACITSSARIPVKTETRFQRT